MANVTALHGGGKKSRPKQASCPAPPAGFAVKSSPVSPGGSSYIAFSIVEAVMLDLSREALAKQTEILLHTYYTKRAAAVIAGLNRPCPHHRQNAVEHYMTDRELDAALCGDDHLSEGSGHCR